MPREMREELAEQFLEPASPGMRAGVQVRWLPKQHIKEAQKRNVQIAQNMTLDQIIELIAHCEPPNPIQVACDRVVSVVRSAISDLPTEQQELITIMLKNDESFRSVLKSET